MLATICSNKTKQKAVMLHVMLQVSKTTVRTQTVKILRLFWHGRNISLKLSRNAILTAKIAENLFGFWGSAPDPAEGAYSTPLNPVGGGNGIAAFPKKPSRLEFPGLHLSPLGLVGPTLKNVYSRWSKVCHMRLIMAESCKPYCNIKISKILYLSTSIRNLYLLYVYDVRI